MEHIRLVATELKNAGFETTVYQNGILVSLNRKVSVMEVDIALNQIFGNIAFRLSSVPQGVFIGMVNSPL